MAIIYTGGNEPITGGIGQVLMQLREAAEKRKLMELERQKAELAIAGVQAPQQQAYAALQAMVGGPPQFAVQQPAPPPVQNTVVGAAPQAPAISGPAVARNSMAALSPEVAAQAQSALAAGSAPAPRRGNADTRFAQAPEALKAVQADRAKRTALGEVDRNIAEIEARVGALTKSGGDLTADAAALSSWRAIRAQIDAGGDPGQLASLAAQMGVDGAGRLKLTLTTEQIRDITDARQADEFATNALVEQGVLARGTPRMAGASTTLLNLQQMRTEVATRESSQMRLISAQGAEERRTIDHRASVEARANALAAYQGLLEMAYQSTKNPTEAMNQATRMLEAQDPALARQLREQGNLAFVDKIVRTRFEVAGYLQSLLQRNFEVSTTQRELSGELPGDRTRRVTGTVNRARPLDVKLTLQAVAEHAATTMGLDRATAIAVLESIGAEKIVEGYNRGARAAMTGELTPVEAQRILEERMRTVLAEPPEDAGWFERLIFESKAPASPSDRRAIRSVFGTPPAPSPSRTPQISARQRADFWRRLEQTNRSPEANAVRRGTVQIGAIQPSTR